MATFEGFKEAENRIEKARATGSKSLNLRSLGLTALPQTIGNLTQLTTLDISINELTELPVELSDITQLSELDLSYNERIRLPEWLGDFTQLNKLDLNKIELIKLPECLRHLTQLVELHLHSNELTELPEWLENLAQLRTLNVNNNQINELPERFRKLTQLKALGIGGNQLARLPEWLGDLPQLALFDVHDCGQHGLPAWLGNLTQLTGLDISTNALIELPEWLKNHTQLTQLLLYNNQLTKLPEWFENLSRLTKLSLNKNRLTTLPNVIVNLTQLTELDVSNNSLFSIPDNIGNLTQLTELDLGNNELTKLPDSFKKLVKLENLDIGANKLTNIPDSFKNLTRLKTLNLGNNKLTTIPEGIGNLTQLAELTLYYNRLAKLPTAIGNLAQLTELSLHNNKLTTLPDTIGNLTNLEALYLANNQLSELPECLGNLTQLTKINLSVNKLSKLPLTFSYLVHLTKLYLRNNEFISLPACIKNLTQLTELQLANNGLADLPEWFGTLTRLTELDLSCNQLTKLPDTFRNLSQLTELQLNNNRLSTLPDAIANLTQLSVLHLCDIELTELPAWFGNLTELTSCDLSYNRLTKLPDELAKLTCLEDLQLNDNKLSKLPDAIANLTQLDELNLDNNLLTELPDCLVHLSRLTELSLEHNPLNPDLEAAYNDGTDAVLKYLAELKESSIAQIEAKLILIGEGEVGKSCLIGALRRDPWIETRDSTHGVEIKPVAVTDPDSGKKITLNAWDFGGQRVYRPTHQLFFSSPAIYLVVWKPREGIQAGAVEEWVRLVKHRAPDAKILVVATHGGQGSRKPDINRQRLLDLFGEETIRGFHHVDNKPFEQSKDGTVIQDGAGIAELKTEIARLAASTIHYRVVSRRYKARKTLQETESSYLTLGEVTKLIKKTITYKEAPAFIRWCHRLGNLIYYDNDPILKDIIILKPDWLATAISLALDDDDIRKEHGLVTFKQLSRIWNDPNKPKEHRYPEELHTAFLRLMERFDISYKVEGSPLGVEEDQTSLIAQLVDDYRPVNALASVWPEKLTKGEKQQTQICRIIDERNQSSPAEGLFFQLIVRLHKYSLGCRNFRDSVHWQTGLILEDGYNGRAFLEHKGNDIHITVRAVYPPTFLAMLTNEVKWLVEHFWEGLRCNIMVPCVEPCGKGKPGTGLYEVEKLIDSLEKGREEYPCPDCGDWQNIEALLTNSPVAARPPIEDLFTEGLDNVIREVQIARQELSQDHRKIRTDTKNLSLNQKTILSRIDDQFNSMMQVFTDEAKDGPRLFSFVPTDTGFLDKPKWIAQQFKLTLWCEHSKLPLPEVNGEENLGVYKLEIPRDWFVAAAPWLGIFVNTLGLMVPVASAATKYVMDDAQYKALEKRLNLTEKSIEAGFKGLEKATNWEKASNDPELTPDGAIMADGAQLRQLHAWLKEKDLTFGGLVRVMDKQQKFRWVHPKFAGEY